MFLKVVYAFTLKSWIYERLGNMHERDVDWIVIPNKKQYV